MKTHTAVLICLCALLLTPLAARASISVIPSDAYLSPSSNTVSFTVLNQTDDALLFKLDLAPWQDDNISTASDEEKMLQSRALSLSSSQLRVPANGKRRVTVALKQQRVEALGLFRLNLNWQSANDDAEPLSLTHSLPIFVTEDNAKQQVHYRTVSRGDNHYLILENHGQKPAHINAYRWQDGEAIPFYAYAWPGMTRYFKLPKGGEGDVTLNVSDVGWIYSDDALQYVSIY